jgi:NAD+-dependent secondary alcohol dehydrogenase Adh1
VAALADGGLSAYHAVRKQLPALEPGSRAVVIGAGWLGHIGIQCLVALTPAEIVVDRDPEALKLAEQCGAHHTVEADGRQVDRVRELTGGTGVEAVLDFVGEDDTVSAAPAMLAPDGRYDVVGFGGTLTIPTVQLVLGELQVAGSLVGAVLVRLAGDGQVIVRAHGPLPPRCGERGDRRPGAGAGARPGDPDAGSGSLIRSGRRRAATALRWPRRRGAASRSFPGV